MYMLSYGTLDSFSSVLNKGDRKTMVGSHKRAFAMLQKDMLQSCQRSAVKTPLKFSPELHLC